MDDTVKSLNDINIKRNMNKNFETYSIAISRLKTLMTDGCLNLNAEYQREYVWESNKINKLIKTIFEDCPIAPLTFHKTIKEDCDDNSMSLYVVMDGKQRIHTILSFVNNFTPYIYGDEKIYFSRIPENADKKKCKVFSKNLQKCFNDYQMRANVYSGLDKITEYRLFDNIQNSVPFLPGQLINTQSYTYDKNSLSYWTRNIKDKYIVKLKEHVYSPINFRHMKDNEETVILSRPL